MSERRFLVVFNADQRRLTGGADDIREALLDSYGFPEWLEAEGVLSVTEPPSATTSPDSQSAAAAYDLTYLIWSNEHRGWWGQFRCGYVKRVSEAGRYSREGALNICRNALGTAGHMGIFAELPVRLEDVEDFVRGQMMPAALI